MKKLIIKIVPLLLIILTLCSVGLVSVSAAVSYTNSSGSATLVCGSYKKTFDAKNYSKNFTRALETALETARKKATSKTLAKVTVAKGYYKINKTLKIYSYTTLDATGSYIRYKGNHLRNGFDGGKSAGYGYTSAKKITVIGGTWEQLVDFKDAASDDSTKWHSTFRFAHCYNLVVKNVAFKNNYNCHDLELAGVRDSEFYNNNFYNDKSVNGISNSGGREPLQIDVTTPTAMPSFPSYDYTPCKNLKIYNNTFKFKFRAIGSHHAVNGKPYDNISVYNNKMSSIAGIAVYAVYWTNSKIYGNEMNDVGLGVDLRNMIGGTSTNFENTDNLSHQQCENAVSKSKTYVYNNKIAIRKFKNILSKTCGIRALGDYYANDSTATGTKAGIYKFYNLNIGVDASGKSMPNRITGNIMSGIQVNYGVNTVIKNNIIDFKNNIKITNNGIELRGCDSTVVSSNNISNGQSAGAKAIYAYESAANTVNTALNINNNSISGYAYAGIMIQKADSPRITGNYISNCTNYSVMLNQTSGAQVLKNTLKNSKYGVLANERSDRMKLESNTISSNYTGLFAERANKIDANKNNISAKTNAVMLRATSDVLLKDNTLTSKLYGVRIDYDCYNTTVNGNRIKSDEDCLYLDGTSSKDKKSSKKLTVINNSLDCPVSKPAIRIINEKVDADIHSNRRSDGGVLEYRFKGEGETKYRTQYGDMVIDNLTFETSGGVTTLNCNSSSKPLGYKIYIGEKLIATTVGSSYTLKSYTGRNVTVVPYKSFGGINLFGVPMSARIPESS